jgi:hypothetical protein
MPQRDDVPKSERDYEREISALTRKAHTLEQAEQLLARHKWLRSTLGCALVLEYSPNRDAIRWDGNWQELCALLKRGGGRSGSYSEVMFKMATDAMLADLGWE